MDDITVRIIGDHGLFSSLGKSIGYHVKINGSVVLVDCGAPLFHQIGVRELKEIEGVVITHCHNDHTKWLVDLALFSRYYPEMRSKVRLMTTEDVYADLVEASKPSLTRSLSDDSKTIIDIPFEEFVEYIPLGPKARYRIVTQDEGNGRFHLAIIDRHGAAAPPDVAKIVIHPGTRRPRLLFRDPASGEWIEPASFYSFSSSIFYEDDKRVFRGDGFTLEALQPPSWHGVPSMAVKLTGNRENLVFSSDTVHNTGLWQRLCGEKRTQRLTMSRRAFERATIIHGDINDYIERIWSEERCHEALGAFSGAAVIHDISSRASVVHTDYEIIRNTTLHKERTLLTHSSDKFSSEWPLSFAGKSYRIRDNGFLEVAGDRLYRLNADIYHKEGGRFFAGYKSRYGRHTVSADNGLIRIAPAGKTSPGTSLYSVDLYEDISGGYYPCVDNTETMYRERRDGRVELVTFSDRGSIGAIAEDQRGHLANWEGERPVEEAEQPEPSPALD